MMSAGLLNDPSLRMSPAHWAAAAFGLLAWRLERTVTRRSFHRSVPVESERFVHRSADSDWPLVIAFDQIDLEAPPPSVQPSDTCMPVAALS
jgi:hypothetical protein